MSAASRFNPYPPLYREAFTFSTILYPQAPSAHLAARFPLVRPALYGHTERGRPTGLPRSVPVPAWVRAYVP